MVHISVLESLAPSLEDLGDSGVITKTAVDFGFGENVLVACACVAVAQTGELIFGECDKFFLLIFGDVAEAIDGFVDGFDDEGEDGVL